MKEGWVYKKLKEIGKTQTGSTPSKSNDAYYGRYMPFIRPAELNFNNIGEINYNSEIKLSELGVNCSRVIDENSTLMCCIGSIGKIGFATQKVTCNQQINAITPNKDYNARFIYYALLSPEFQEEVIKIANSARATLAIISKGKWENISIPIPPLFEQQRIVSYLDAEFAKIEALKANAEKQLQAAKDLFQAALKELLTPKEGWEEKKFGDVCHYYKVQGKWENIEYIGLEHIEAHTSNLLATISANDVESSTFKFNKGDVLYGRLRPYLQKVVIAPFDGCCSTEIFPIKSNIINNAFLKYWLLSDWVTEIMINSCSGCRMPRANMNDFKQETIHYPQFEDQQRIADRLDVLSANVKALQTNYTETITLCNDLKQALLKKVFEEDG